MSAPPRRLVGIGVGPFNLGLACLTQGVPELEGVFLERKPAFDWHTNILMTHARMQTPFTADLVTLADPTSPFSFLNFLKQHRRLHAFMIRKDFYPLREEFNQYYQWCASQLPGIHFNRTVTGVEYDQSNRCYHVEAEDTNSGGTISVTADALVVGTGTTPHWPDRVSPELDGAVHSSEYLSHRRRIRNSRRIAIVGGGQSGAEIFLDLLQSQDEHNYELLWLARSSHFFPTEEGKLTLEMTSPSYVEHFFSLPDTDRRYLLDAQENLHKGSRLETLDEIFDELYARHVQGGLQAELLPATSLERAFRTPQEPSINLELAHNHSGSRFMRSVDTVILATGYDDSLPDFLDGIKDRILLDEHGRPDFDLNHAADINRSEIFIQNADLHTHGFSTSDLSMSCHYNSRIINTVVGRTVYTLDHGLTFQNFSPGQINNSQDSAGPSDQ